MNISTTPNKAAGSCDDGRTPQQSPTTKPRPKYYAVAIGRHTGVFDNTRIFMAAKEGVPGARFKGFSNLEEAMRFVQDIQSIIMDHEQARRFLADEAVIVRHVGPALAAMAVAPPRGADEAPSS